MTICHIPPLTIIPGSPLDPAWDGLPRLAVAHFHADSSTHRPRVSVQIGHTDLALHLRFTVQDRHVVSRLVTANDLVCKDSCVEFFVEPLPGAGYFNLEVNAGGTIHCSHVTDPTPSPLDPRKLTGCELLTAAELACIQVATTLPARIDPELAGPLDWAMCARLPFDLFSQRLGRRPPVPGRWRGNFYKCADHCSMPHWASWAPIGERLAFHVPQHFGILELT